MIKSFFLLIFFTLAISCIDKTEVDNESNQLPTITDYEKVEKFSKAINSEIEPYDFDTILNNNFHLSYRVYKDTIENGTLQSLTLVKDSIDIKRISVTSLPMLHKNLGYVGADYGSSFLFVQSYGSGNPHEIQLINKKDGEIITSGTFVDQNENKKVLLYIKNKHKENEKLLLLDIERKKERMITEFQYLKTDCGKTDGLRNCIVIDRITKNQITLRANAESSTKIKIYNR